MLLLSCRVRRLIVNADDFGLTRGVNRAILEAHENGIVTSSTLMANSAGFDDAIRLAQCHPKLAVGCHTMLVDGTPLLSPNQVATLIKDSRSSEFLPGIAGCAFRALTGRIAADQVEAEVTAQIHKLQSAGIAVSHLDTHKHTHLFPQILRPLLSAARACGVRAIRNPFGRIAFSAIAARPNLWKRYGQLRILNALAARFRRAVADAGMVTTDGSIGIAATGALDDRLFRWLFENLPEGTWEFVCHPGYNDADLDKIQTRLRQSREIELALLTSPTTREILAQNQVELISFRDLR
jgi:chitin disaccharide deacetylase